MERQDDTRLEAAGIEPVSARPPAGTQEYSIEGNRVVEGPAGCRGSTSNSETVTRCHTPLIAAPLLEHPRWPELARWLRVQPAEPGRVRLELKAVPADAASWLLALLVGCCACARLIHPVRQRRHPGNKRDAKVGHSYYLSVACPLSVSVGCSRGPEAKAAYVAIQEALGRLAMLVVVAMLAWSAVAQAQVPDWAFAEARCQAYTCFEGGYCTGDLVSHSCSQPCLTAYISLDGGITCEDGSKPGWVDHSPNLAEPSDAGSAASMQRIDAGWFLHLDTGSILKLNDAVPALFTMLGCAQGLPVTFMVQGRIAGTCVAIWDGGTCATWETITGWRCRRPDGGAL